jgi:hypothetical protein
MYPELTEEQIRSVTDANSRILRVGAPALSGVEKRIPDLVAHLVERGTSQL